MEKFASYLCVAVVGAIAGAWAHRFSTEEIVKRDSMQAAAYRKQFAQSHKAGVN